jgi:protein transport protein SEC31
LQEFCAHKAANAAAAGAQEDSETWTFMGVLFEDDARRQLLAKLGFAEALSAAAQPTAAAGGDAAGGLVGSSSVDVAGQQLHSAMEQLGLGDGELLCEGWIAR